MKSLFKAALAIVAFALVLPLAGILTPGGAVPGAFAAPQQTGSTRLLPQIVQPGKSVVGAGRARLAGSVVFRPIRKGRPVTIQRKVPGGAWKNVTTKRQNGAGIVRFRAGARGPGGKWYTYRGVAHRWKGLRRVRARAQSAAVWDLKFEDQFRLPTLDLAKWSYRQLSEYNAQSDRACSSSHPDAVEVRDGRLLLRVEEDSIRAATGPCSAKNRDGEPYTKNATWYKNGHISTQKAVDGVEGQFRYGVAAARMKFDRNVGAHGAFWMQSTVRNRDGIGPARDGAEIDIVEYFGERYWRGDVYQFVHYTDASGQAHKVPSGGRANDPAILARRALTSRRDDWFKSYHVFSVEWTPKVYHFRVDGIRTRTIRRGVSRVPEYLILSMLSSGWELERMDRKTLPNATHVDWVRFWQK